jgi:putative salt-induced outer membrane protein
MRAKFILIPILLGLAAPLAAQADPVPPKVADMIRAAAKTGDAAQLATTVSIAKKANPRSAREIDALAAQLKNWAAARNRFKLRRQSFFQGWKGQGEVGAANSTGNTRSTSVALGLNFTRKGLRWDHAFTATADYQRDNGVESESRYFASYSGHHKMTDRLYALGLVSWEDNRFAGFHTRLSESLGLGYSFLNGPKMTLAVEAGPALRQTEYIAAAAERKFAGRASLNYRWDILPDLALTEVATFYSESEDSTLTSDTGLTTTLIGSLSARASYHIQRESSPPPPLRRTDATTRLTLVYNF